MSDPRTAGERGIFDPFPGTDATMFIQWKGTGICMDFTCGQCESSGHVDGDFPYFIRCGGCGAVYEMGTQVRARLCPDGLPPGVSAVLETE